MVFNVFSGFFEWFGDNFLDGLNGFLEWLMFFSGLCEWFSNV